MWVRVFCVSAMLALSGSTFAQELSDYDKSELWFNSLSEADRKDIQSSLIWTGDYNQLLDGEFGYKGLDNAPKSGSAGDKFENIVHFP